MGDPAGVGPEVIVKALASPRISGLANFLVIGDGGVFEAIARRLRKPFKARVLDMGNVPRKGFVYGRTRPSFGTASIEYLDQALLLLDAGKADCLVTGPINKMSVRLGAFRGFQGHTEYLAAKTSTDEYAMMFVGRSLKVTLVTRHIALRNVAGRVTPELVSRAIRLTDSCLRKYFGVRNPRIAVAGLNPHAGEAGAFGDEETRLIAPVIKTLNRSIKGLRGPMPADVVFYDALKGRFDAVIAMYHDQGLIPFKMLYFDCGVNMTLGLPFIRTSPDHGTAFDIAGKGIANPDSMIEAIKLACRLARSGS